jgi:predicted site-specific integrase-resolvase
MANQTSNVAGHGQMRLRCAIYTRKSSEEGLEQNFNSLDAQREACEAYIASQKHEGWTILPEMYDDGGFSGGTIERPAFQRLLVDVGEGKIDVVVVYKVDRLTRFRLTLLAPDIVSAILGGKHPPELNARKLLDDTRLPLDWNEQRRSLGFP